MSNAFLDTALNAALDAMVALFDESSLHTAFSTTGANEVTGGSYARQANTWNGAASGAVDNSNAPSFSVPSGNTIRFIGFYDTVPSPDVFQGMLPNQQAGDEGPRRFVVDVSGNIIEDPINAFVDDENLVFVGGTAPGGLTEGTVYWIITRTAAGYQVSATQGGGAITLTDQGDQDVRIWQIREETFASDGTFNLTDADIDFDT
jgi:hypothetical protein